MAKIQLVHFEPRPIERFETLLGHEAMAEVRHRAQSLNTLLAGRAIWNVNSTASGGGVAEMLSSLLGYPRSLRMDVRWAVIEGTPEFFTVTKRVHHALQGSRGDGSPLGDAQHAIYELVSEENADELRRLITPGDVVILHDPQTAGLAPHLIEHGCSVVWRCHIGDDQMNAEHELGWTFLSRYLADVSLSIFSRHSYVPPTMSRTQTVVIPPSIDPFSPKSEMLDEVTVRSVLARAGLIADGATERPFEFAAIDGSLRHVDRRAHVVDLDGRPAWEAPMVIQVSRWDPLKDPIGVMDAFVRIPTSGRESEPHLMLVGPEVTGVADDPEAAAVFESVLSHWQTLPEQSQRRIHLASLPTADPVENATIVNALQSHARVTVQKSLREGFGLTVTEAMWKACPVVATRVGGIQDQIDHNVEGLLVDDPRDLDAASRAIRMLLDDDDLSERLGKAARMRVIKEFLPPRHLLQYADLIEGCLPLSGAAAEAKAGRV
jgi:trehalose synthase